jgi:aminoglycoside phosphotransferase (APT) family kinase protein
VEAPGPLTAQTASALVRRWLGEDTRDVAPIGCGEVNTVFAVTTSRRRLVVRMQAGADPDGPRKERWCLERASAAGIPGPDLLAGGTEGQVTFTILGFLPGTPGSALPGPRVWLWRTLGAYAARIHGIPVVGHGDRLDERGRFSDSWRRFVDYNIGELSAGDPLLALGVLRMEDLARLRAAFADLASRTLRFGLVHGDLSPRNTIVSAETVWLLDWGSAAAAPVPHGDLAELLQCHEELAEPSADGLRSFFDGYGSDAPDPAELAAYRALGAVDTLPVGPGPCPRPDRLRRTGAPGGRGPAVTAATAPGRGRRPSRSHRPGPGGRRRSRRACSPSRRRGWGSPRASRPPAGRGR